MQTYSYQYGKMYQGDVLACAEQIPDHSVDCVITSPPYWQLRDYGFPEQWGLEPTYKEYLAHLQELMTEIWRVLKPQGTVWVNLGDTYSGSNGFGWKQSVAKVNQSNGSENNNVSYRKLTGRTDDNIQDKSLMLIPHRFVIQCIDNGWILRNDIIWAKPNAMPESVTDRFSKKKEFMFFMVKQGKYYFDLDSVREKPKYVEEMSKPFRKSKLQEIGLLNGNHKTHSNPLGKNCGDVTRFWEGKEISLEEYLEIATEYFFNEMTDSWEIPTRPSSNEHYASYNLELIKKPILAGCPPDGVIFDPFMGTGTTAVAAMKYGRRFIGSEGSAEYIKIADRNILETEKQLAYEKAQNNLF